MNKDRKIELRERAMKILGLNVFFNANELLTNFRRQIKLVNPNSPDVNNYFTRGYVNKDVAMLLIQARAYLINRKFPTTMLERDDLVGFLIGDKNITPIEETRSFLEGELVAHYDFGGSWPEVSEEESERQREYKFKGIC